MSSWAGRKVSRREKLTARSYTATFCDDLLTMAIEAESGLLCSTYEPLVSGDDERLGGFPVERFSGEFLRISGENWLEVDKVFEFF